MKLGVRAAIPKARAWIADDDQVGAFLFGFALGALFGYRLVVPPPPRRLQPAGSRPEAAPAQVREPATIGVPVWQERTDVYRPAAAVQIPSQASLWESSSLVAITPDAQDAMDRHARSDMRRERVGLLVGRAGRSPNSDRMVTIVERAVPLPSSDATGTRVALTTESLPYAAAAIRQLPAGATVVGWFHTHPGLGIFLSGTDRHTQRTCFRESWHVAVVLDPNEGSMGVFTGPEGEPTQRRVHAQRPLSAKHRFRRVKG